MNNRFVNYINCPTVWLALFLICILFSCQDNRADGKTPSPLQTSDKSQYVTGEYLITLEPSAGEDFIRQFFFELEVISINPQKLIGDNVYLLKIRRDPGPEEIRKKCAGNSKIKSIQPNYIYKMFKNK